MDRHFTFTMHRFSPVTAVVRVVYPDLVVDLKSVEVFETVPFLQPFDPSSTGNDREASGIDAVGDNSGETARKSTLKDSDVANVAHIDCIPINIPLGETQIFI